jgi:glycosyltransferase involved in cell wall biosynthesis
MMTTTNLPIDSVYFFMWAGWRDSARSNRWHYGLRWGRHVPVVFVQPELPAGAPWRSEPEPRIHNVEILSTQASDELGRPSFDEGLIQARQIVSYMRRCGHRHPLLWFYNPYLTFAYALVPGSLRVFHATENYFDPDTTTLDLADLKRAAIAISDKVICCSTGVFEGCREATGRSDLEMIPNGCDYPFYAKPKPPKGNWMARLQPILSSGHPIAVFAGNINIRMDFPLMQELADKLNSVHFVYAGAVAHDRLISEDRASWAALLKRPNVSYLGMLDPEDLPQLYWLADRGFIPYRHLPFLVQNGFPLKALEMAAAGLPVVSSLMEPLRDVAEAVEIVTDGGAFVEQLRKASRRTRSPEVTDRVDRLCQEYDYDRHFERMLEIVIPSVSPGPPRPASLQPLYDRLGCVRTLWDLEPAVQRPVALPPAASPPAASPPAASTPAASTPAVAPPIELPGAALRPARGGASAELVPAWLRPAITRMRRSLRARAGQLLRLFPPSIRQLVPIPILNFAKRWTSDIGFPPGDTTAASPASSADRTAAQFSATLSPEPTTICILALSIIADDPRVRRQAEAFHHAGWKVVAVGEPGAKSPPPDWSILTRDDLPPASAAPTAIMLPELAKESYWSQNLLDIYHCAQRVNAAIWLANDWTMLPIAGALARDKGGLYGYDTHEFAVEEYAENPKWRLMSRPTVSAIEEKFIGDAAVVSAVSAGIAEGLDKLYRLPRPTLIIRNTSAFEEVPFRPTRRDRIQVLYHGIVVPNRGIEASIDSVILWRPEITLTIRGPENPAFSPALRERIAALGLEHRVRLAPPVPMTALVREAALFDVGFFALPGHSQHNEFALPNKFFEYVMAGLALCTTDLPEMARLIRQYELGVTIAAVEPEAIAAAINALEPDCIDCYKRNALVAARELCWERESQRLVGAYGAALAQSLRQPR